MVASGASSLWDTYSLAIIMITIRAILFLDTETVAAITITAAASANGNTLSFTTIMIAISTIFFRETCAIAAIMEAFQTLPQAYTHLSVTAIMIANTASPH